MRLLWAVLPWCCGLLVGVPAFAQPANRQADAEARSFLPPCQESDPQREALCQTNQRSFVEQYIFAKAGDLLAMGITAAAFGPHNGERSETEWLGVPQAPVQACAWRMVRFERSHDKLDEDASRRACGTLSDGDRTKAAHRAEQLVHELNTSPAKLPEAG